METLRTDGFLSVRRGPVRGVYRIPSVGIRIMVAPKGFVKNARSHAREANSRW